jgi:hypothetical protein
MTENEKRHIVNTIVLALPKQDQDFNYFLQDRVEADGFSVMGLKKPNFGTVGACTMPDSDRKGDLVGQKKIPLSRYGITKQTSYSPKEFFVYMTQKDFFKLMSELSADERSLLDTHRGVKKLWQWNGSKFIYHSASLGTFESLNSKILCYVGIKKKDRLLQAV